MRRSRMLHPRELGSVITHRDMYFHEPRYRDFRWLETNCYSFTIPEAHMGGQIWAGFRTNLDVAASRIWIWSSTNPHAGPAELDYNDERYHLPLPQQQLTNFRLANGLAVRMTKPLMEWKVRYEGVDDTVLDLDVRGLCPPLHISETGTKDAQLGTLRLDHLDQMMAVSGTVRIYGTEYKVNWPSWRDHSWSPRPEGPAGYGYGVTVSSNFDYGAFGDEYAFFVITSNQWHDATRGVVVNGYLIDHGETLRLRQGEGHYDYDEQWTIRHLKYELEDERGRLHSFVGEPLGFDHRGRQVSAVVRWETRDKQTGWGQYIWHGNLEQQRRHQPWKS